jgi:hypothetical protein
MDPGKGTLKEMKEMMGAAWQAFDACRVNWLGNRS